jgi:hypothetical protein
MGQIDVSDIMVDPDIVDPIVIIHRTPDTDQYGENRLKECGVNTFGSVQPVSGKTLQRLPEKFQVANVKSFWVKGMIVSDGSCKYPDIIVSKGVRYAVQMIFDWTNWGSGWTEGTAVQERPAL